MTATTRSRKAKFPPVAWATTALLVSSCAAFTASPSSFQQHRTRRLQQQQQQGTTGRGPWGGSRCEQCLALKGRKGRQPWVLKLLMSVAIYRDGGRCCGIHKLKDSVDAKYGSRHAVTHSSRGARQCSCNVYSGNLIGAPTPASSCTRKNDRKAPKASGLSTLAFQHLLVWVVGAVG